MNILEWTRVEKKKLGARSVSRLCPLRLGGRQNPAGSGQAQFAATERGDKEKIRVVHLWLGGGERNQG